MIDDAAIPSFITELREAAKDIYDVTMDERRRLLERAARTVRDYRYEIKMSCAPANDDGAGDIATHWAALAAGIEDVPDGSVAAVLIDAAENIHACKVLMDAKLEILRNAEPEGRA